MSEGSIDVAVTYNEAAEKQKMDSGDAVQNVYGFRVSTIRRSLYSQRIKKSPKDHFYLVGPKSNPAGLTTNDSVLDIFNKFVALGNRDDMVWFLFRI